MLPIVVIQGIWVRRKTMRLPEPEGLREFGHVEVQKRGVSVLVLGDSAAAGVGAKTQESALAGLLFSQLKVNREVKLSLKATTGFLSRDVIETLITLHPQQYEVVLVSMGVNDVTKLTSIRRWKRNVNEIISLLTSKFSSKLVIFTALPPMHLFPALPQPLRWVLGLRANLLNRELEKCSSLYAHVDFLDIPFMSQGESLHSIKESGLMAEDGFHPSSKGYALWAKQVAIVTEKYCNVGQSETSD